jgi:hypothetical protein
MEDKIRKLEVFEEALWNSYNKVKLEEKVIWVSLHKVMEYVGLPLPLFTERLEQLWQGQFSMKPLYCSKYTFGLEVDATPTERYRLRKKLIIVDHCPRFIIQMGLKK